MIIQYSRSGITLYYLKTIITIIKACLSLSRLGSDEIITHRKTAQKTTPWQQVQLTGINACETFTFITIQRELITKNPMPVYAIPSDKITYKQDHHVQYKDGLSSNLLRIIASFYRRLLHHLKRYDYSLSMTGSIIACRLQHVNCHSSFTGFPTAPKIQSIPNNDWK